MTRALTGLIYYESYLQESMGDNTFLITRLREYRYRLCANRVKSPVLGDHRVIHILDLQSYLY